MPSEKTKSKEDTWTPQELEKSLKEIRGDKRRSRDRDDGQDGDKERRRRHHEDVDGHKERRRKDEDGKKLDKEIDDIKRDERRMKDEDREERHRKKREERKNREETTEDKDDRSKRRSENGDSRDEQDRHKRDANNHNGRDDDKRRREKDRSRNREHKDDREKRHHSRDGRPERDSEKADRRSEKNGEERRRSHKDDEDRRRKPRDEEEKKRSHRTEDEKRSHKDGDDRRRSHRDDSGRRRSHREDDERRKHKNDDEKRRSHRDDDDDVRKRSNRDDDDRKRSNRDDDDRKRSNRDDDDRKRSNRDDDDKRRKHRDDDDKRRRPRNEDDRRRSYKDEERKESGKVRQEEDSRERRSSDKDKRHRRSEDKKEGKKDRLKEEERYVGAKHKTDQSDVEEEDPPKQENAGEDYEDDFEDYEEDFEDDADDTDDDKPANEVDAVLKALDAENERLMVESRRSNNSDSTDLSDDRFRPSHSANQQRVFVNFVSAKQMVLSDKASSKARTRGRDLLQLIDLDVSSYEMFDLPPIKEYDLYIRNYGRTDTNQVYVQTNEDNIDRDIQTEDIEYDDKWSQHPSDDTVACGRGDGNKERRDEEEFNTGQHLHSEDLTKLTRFIEKAGQAISILLEEETESEKSNPTTQSNISVSQGYSQLTTPSFLKGHSLRQNVFSTRQPNLLLSLYSSSIEKGDHNPITGGLGCICVWNISEPSFPQRTLVCDSIPTCCCFSPSNTSLIFAGMADGSLVLWDTREPASLHHSVTVEGRELCLRHPTYNTAGVLSTDNHQSSVVKITPTLPPIVSSNSSTSVAEVLSGASYQIISIDESGCMNLWVVAEISSSDIAGSESDLGLSPGGKVKLLRSSSFTLDNPVKDARLKSNLKITYLQLNPKDSNLFLAGTDAGFIVHGARYGSKPIPRVYLGVSDSPVPVTCIDFSPFCNPCFLAGCADGNVRLYHSHSSKPLISWTSSEEGVSVVSVQWSTNRPGVFYVLYSNSNLAVYDLVEMDTKPTALDHITGSGRVIDMVLSPDAHCRGQGEPQKHPHLVLTMDTGLSEIHAISKTLVEPQPFEEDFLNSYLDRF